MDKEEYHYNWWMKNINELTLIPIGGIMNQLDMIIILRRILSVILMIVMKII